MLLRGLLLFFAAQIALPGLGDGTGRVVRLHGRNFFFEVLEPKGWTLDTRSAPQLANFIFHPTGVDWRESEALILVRFAPREPSDELEDFLKQSREGFLEDCPFAEDSDESDLGLKLMDRYRIQVYDCPGVRKEVAAITAVPGYFVIFTLSAQSEVAFKENLDTFRNVAESFVWSELKVPSPTPRPRGGGTGR